MIEKAHALLKSGKGSLETRRLPRKKLTSRSVHVLETQTLRIRNFPMHFEFWKFFTEQAYFGQFGQPHIDWLKQGRRGANFSDLAIHFTHPLSAALAFLVLLHCYFSCILVIKGLARAGGRCIDRFLRGLGDRQENRPDFFKLSVIQRPPISISISLQIS